MTRTLPYIYINILVRFTCMFWLAATHFDKKLLWRSLDLLLKSRCTKTEVTLPTKTSANDFFVTHFFISNPIFRLSLELLSEVPKMRLKIAMKLLTFFGDFRLK